MAKLFGEIKKFNPYHDKRGRFSSANGAASFTYKPGKGKEYDNAIEREKQRSNENFDPFEVLTTPQWFYDKPAPKKGPMSPGLNEDGSPKGQVKGKDIKNSIEMPDGTPHYRSGNAKGTTDVVAETQGYKEKPTVLSREEFEKAATRTGIIAYRTVSEGEDVVSGEFLDEKQMAEKLMYAEPNDFALNGSGVMAYGGGVYLAANKLNETTEGKMPDGSQARIDSVAYARSANPAVMTMTLSPTAKIGDFWEVRKLMSDEPEEVAEKFNYDVGAYAAARGFDGLRIKSGGCDCDYLTIMNRSALIICDEIEDEDGDRWKDVGEGLF